MPVVRGTSKEKLYNDLARLGNLLKQKIVQETVLLFKMLDTNVSSAYSIIHISVSTYNTRNTNITQFPVKHNLF